MRAPERGVSPLPHSLACLPCPTRCPARRACAALDDRVVALTRRVRLDSDSLFGDFDGAPPDAPTFAIMPRDRRACQRHAASGRSSSRPRQLQRLALQNNVDGACGLLPGVMVFSALIVLPAPPIRQHQLRRPGGTKTAASNSLEVAGLRRANDRTVLSATARGRLARRPCRRAWSSPGYFGDDIRVHAQRLEDRAHQAAR